MDNSNNNEQPQHDAIGELHSQEMEEPSPGNKEFVFLVHMITARVERILENYVIYLINSIETYVYSFNFPSFHFYQPVSASDHVMVPSKMFQQNAQAK